jgi:hypothetical protein
MAITNKGVTYPTSSDNIAPLETHFANLANTADNIGALAGSESFTGPASTGGYVDVPVSFNDALSAAPFVIAVVQGGSTASPYSATILGTPTTSAFTARVHRLAGSTAETNLKLVWMASTYSAI